MLVIGAKGDPFKVPVIKNVEIESDNKICLGNLLLVEEEDYNLLGRDMIIALGINLTVKDSRLVVSLYKLTTKDEGKIDPKVWYSQGEVGRLEIEPISIEIEKPEEPIRIKQYPISMEGRMGLKQVIDDLIKKGTLEPCMSRHNTPILAVSKTDESYRLVQDLRAVNERTRTRFPVVANPYTLLNRVSPEDVWYREKMLVIGAKGDPFKVPVIKNVEIESDNKICLGNLLLVEEEDYNLLGRDMIIALGINLTVKDSRLVVSLYKLTTKDEGKIDPKVWYSQGEVGRLEIEPISIEIEKPEEPIRIKQYPISMEGRMGLKQVIDDLIKKGTLEPCMSRHNTPILAVSKTDESYRLVQDLRAVNERTRTRFPVVANPYTLLNRVSPEDVWYRDWAGAKKPVDYVSKLLDPVSRGWPTCLQAIVAVALLMEEAKKMTFRAPLVVYSPHNVRSILQQKADKWLTDARLLKYEAILVHSHGLELRTTAAQNLAQFWFGEALGETSHNCTEMVELQTKVRPDLGEEELEEGEKWFVDGSASVIEGKRKSGYAIVDDKSGEVVESGPLNANWCAQAWHQVGMQFQTRDNNLADKEAKRAALLTVSIPVVREEGTLEYPPYPSQKEIEEFEKIGGRYKFLLVIVDKLTHLVEAYRRARAMAQTVSKVLLEEIIPHYGIVDHIDSD
ncbi:hypothetical protein HGM15179_019292 [Zosterops borbonicus]|uniref:Reverse transcriptase RNase H-like domain-containing protein n=1 Tax=Zosterops borbonicus TaxID=364589 RepID=A0A8K1DBS4_9PASS|nr:hypothetical protein HGM15179_019292 [Zosterops borbonicus]